MNKQQEVIPLLGALVGFTQEEYQKAIDALATHYQHNTSTGWFSGWLGANAARSTLSKDTPVYHPDKVGLHPHLDTHPASLSNLVVRRTLNPVR